MPVKVPEVILVGTSARYRHFSRGTCDLYAPEEMLPDPPPPHVWAYCVSRVHGNTVYFHNEASGRSLWVLPCIDASSGESKYNEGEAMRVIGSVPSAAVRQKRVAFEKSNEGDGVAADGSRIDIMPEGAQENVLQVQNTVGINQQDTKSNKENNNNNNNNNNNSTVPVRERLAVWRAKRTQQEEHSENRESSKFSSSHAKEDAWSSGSAMSHRLRFERHPSFGQRTMKGEASSTKAMTNSSSCLDTKGSVPCAEDDKKLDASQNNYPTGSTACPPRDMYEEERRLFLEANEEVQREKAVALEKERLRLEQMARLQEQQLREEEERTKLAKERKLLEQKRLDLQKRICERQHALLTSIEEEMMQRELAAQLNRFFENKSRLEKLAQLESERLLSYEDAIVESLLGTVSRSGSATQKEERRIDLRFLEEDDDGDAEEKEVKHRSKSGANSPEYHDYSDVRGRGGAGMPNTSNESRQKSSQQKKRHQARCESITYSPSLMYVGDATEGGGKPPFFLRRQGRGTFFYDASKKYFFEGEWLDDRRNGHGVISLPHVVVEGSWRNDQLEGCATFQSRRVKGRGEFHEGALEGNAVVEIDSNGVFAGNVKKNAALVNSAAITLSSGDHIEWIGEELNEARRKKKNNNMKNEKTNHSQDDSKTSQHVSSGSGKCRIRFKSGDVYVGQVKDHQPHGTGTYQFAKEGHEYVGEFSHGCLQGHGTYRFANGNVYIGQLYKGLFHGEGQYVQQNDYIYEGLWQYGTAHGKGKLIFANGDVWEGEFDHDRRVKGHYTASHLFQL